MTSSEKDEKESGTDSSYGGDRVWRPVDAEIWNRRTEPSKGILPWFNRFLYRKISSIVSSPLFLLFFAAPAGAAVVLTFALAYYLGGDAFIGPVFVGIWAGIIIGAVVFLEKIGVSRNFAGWDYSLRRIVLLPIVFLLAVGFFYFLAFLGFLLR